MKITPTTQAEMDYAHIHPYQDAVKKYPVMPVTELNCLTIRKNNSIMGVCGVVVLWEGVGELWLILTSDFREYIAGSINRRIQALLDMSKVVTGLIQSNNLRRVQTTVRANFPESIRLHEYLGMKREGLRPEYFPGGEDAIMYGKVI